jgi:hypothetical protein
MVSARVKGTIKHAAHPAQIRHATRSRSQNVQPLHEKWTHHPSKTIFVPYDTISLDGKPKRTSMKKEMNFAKLVYFIMTLTLPLFKDIAVAAILAINDVALNALKSSITYSDTFWNYIAGEIYGVPNCLNGETTYQQFQNYKKEANHKSIIGHETLVQTQFVKEYARNIGLPFDANLVDFIPHVGIVPIGIVTSDHKKARLYRHGTLKLDANSQPINTIVLREETEAEIRYQAALKNHLQYIWRLRGTYPN